MLLHIHLHFSTHKFELHKILLQILHLLSQAARPPAGRNTAVLFPSNNCRRSKSKAKSEAMNQKNGNGPNLLDLKLNLSPPHVQSTEASPSQSSSPPPPPATPNSCVSSEVNLKQQEENNSCSSYFTNSPGATTMIVAGCPRCLMYVMLPEKKPRCPKCKSTVLLQFFNDLNNNNKENK